jgi:sugar lactone lactonase YvrE
MKTSILLLALLGAAQVSLHAQVPTITNQPASQALWAGGNVTFTVGVSGAWPFTYHWLLNGTNLPDGIITTVAGNGTYSYSGDGGAATNASLESPFGVTVDVIGNLFIADHGNNRIRKVDIHGIITTVAGNGVLDPSGESGTFSGDGGAATNAGLSLPFSVAVDNFGNLFIADANNRIRKVNTDGIITTVAGGGSGGDGGAATNASLNMPYAVTVDTHGDLFIADCLNNCVREVSANGIITTAAGGGSGGDGGPAADASLSYPSGVALDGWGNLFIADQGNYRIRKVDTNGIITTVAGNGSYGYSGDGGAATNASLSYPDGIAGDASSNLFIADGWNNAIRKVDANGIITTVAGGGSGGDGGPATNASLCDPFDVAVDGFGNLFIADMCNNCIRKVTNTQGPALVLNNVSAANAGNYQVVVTGPGGSVTSSVANLIVASSPLIYQTVLNSNGSLALCLVSPPGSTNVVQCATNLSPPVFWQPLSTNMAGSDGDWQFTDINTAGYQARFYRSLTQ